MEEALEVESPNGSFELFVALALGRLGAGAGSVRSSMSMVEAESPKGSLTLG